MSIRHIVVYYIEPGKCIIVLFMQRTGKNCLTFASDPGHVPKVTVANISVIFVTKIKTRTRIIGHRFQRTRTRIIVIQKTKTK